MGLYEIEATIECQSQVLVICNFFGIACVLWLVGGGEFAPHCDGNRW
jgi:hypothetical protein